MHKVSQEQIAFTLKAIGLFKENQDVITATPSGVPEEDSFFVVRWNDRSAVSFTVTSVLHVTTEDIIGHPMESIYPSSGQASPEVPEPAAPSLAEILSIIDDQEGNIRSAISSCDSYSVLKAAARRASGILHLIRNRQGQD